PDLKFKPKPNECDLRGNARMSFRAFAEDNPPLGIDFQNFASALERHGKILKLLRIGREPGKKFVNLLLQAPPAAIQRLESERVMNIKPASALEREHRPEPCRYRDPPLGIKPASVMRDEPKPFHSGPRKHGTPPRPVEWPTIFRA